MTAAPIATRSTFPRRLTAAWALLVNYAYDYGRYRKAWFVAGAQSREQRRAHILLLGHSLERGLSLASPRPGFGIEKVRQLGAELNEYLTMFGQDDTTDTARAVLEAYAAFNAAHGADAVVARNILAEAAIRAGTTDKAVEGGAELVRADDIRKRSAIDFLAMVEARHSIRHYADRPVEFEKIERAVRAAQQTPSSCNRQTCKVYCYTNKKSIARIMALHDGNRGFGEQLGGVFVVTVDLLHWNSIGERNQGWVDGGMFAMSLLLGLHAEGLGACTLNWSATREQDRAMRACLVLPDNEIIITLVGFGHMPDEFRVPVSKRRPLDKVLIHEPLLSDG